MNVKYLVSYSLHKVQANAGDYSMWWSAVSLAQSNTEEKERRPAFTVALYSNTRPKHQGLHKQKPVLLGTGGSFKQMWPNNYFVLWNHFSPEFLVLSILHILLISSIWCIKQNIFVEILKIYSITSFSSSLCVFQSSSLFHFVYRVSAIWMKTAA